MITIKTIIEVIGFPAEHVDKTMNQIVERVEKEDGIKVVQKVVHKSNPIKKFFSAFVELELDVDDLERLFRFCLDYHPSSVEIQDKKSIEIESRELTIIINDMLGILHQYNMLTKNLEAQLIQIKRQSEPSPKKK